MKFNWIFTLIKNMVKPQYKLSSKALKLLRDSTSGEHKFILGETSAGRGVGGNNVFKK